MNAEDILSILKERNKGPGFAMLNVLKKVKPNKVNRKELITQADTFLVTNGRQAVFSSRHGIEKYIARLDGAGLINIEEDGTSHVYSISPLGERLLDYSNSIKQKSN